MVVAAPMDQFAKRIARDLARGRAPSLTDEIAAYPGSEPRRSSTISTASSIGSRTIPTRP